MAGKKRSNGTGNIRKRSDGRWESRIMIGTDPGTGKPIIKSYFGKTEKEVRDKLQHTAVELSEGTYKATPKITVKAWCEQWINEFTSDIKNSTRVRYRQIVYKNIIPALGATQLAALSPLDVQKFYNSLKSTLAPKSIKNVHGLLHQILNQAIRMQLIRVNPTEACTIPRAEKKEIEILDMPDVRTFFQSLGTDDVFDLIFQVDLLTGLRSGEILALQWKNINFNTGTILIDKTLYRPRGKGETHYFTSPKNGKSRIIYPAPFVMNLLLIRRKKQRADRLKAGPAWDNTLPDLVFTNEIGHCLDANTVLRHLKRKLAAAGLPAQRFHDLRHCYATAALTAGDPVQQVQEALGHYSPDFTLRVYTHVVESIRRDSAKHMQQFIESTIVPDGKTANKI